MLLDKIVLFTSSLVFLWKSSHIILYLLMSEVNTIEKARRRNEWNTFCRCIYNLLCLVGCDWDESRWKKRRRNIRKDGQYRRYHSSFFQVYEADSINFSRALEVMRNLYSGFIEIVVDGRGGWDWQLGSMDGWLVGEDRYVRSVHLYGHGRGSWISFSGIDFPLNVSQLEWQ